MSNVAYTVRARWDEESKSWWTDGEDIPGLCCQADSFEELIEAVLALASQLAWAALLLTLAAWLFARGVRRLVVQGG